MAERQRITLELAILGSKDLRAVFETVLAQTDDAVHEIIALAVGRQVEKQQARRLQRVQQATGGDSVAANEAMATLTPLYDLLFEESTGAPPREASPPIAAAARRVAAHARC